MPNFIILVIALLTVLMLCHHSSKYNAEQSRRELADMPNPPTNAAVDNHISGSVAAFCFLIVVVAVALAFLMPR